MGSVLDCDIVVHEFELHLLYWVYFWTNTLRQGKSWPRSNSQIFQISQRSKIALLLSDAI